MCRASTSPARSRPRRDPRYAPGDQVVLTGWRVGEAHWGGYAQKARVKADWLVPLPEGLTPRQAMAVGTAGLTSMLAVMALEDHGLTPGHGPGAGDRRGRRRRLGRGRACSPRSATRSPRSPAGRRQEGYLRDLGAARIVPRGELAEAPTRSRSRARPGRGCIDAVGGAMLSRVLTQMKYRCAVAAVGAGRRRGRAAVDRALPAARREPARHRQRAAALREPGPRPGRGSPATCRWTSSRR